MFQVACNLWRYTLEFDRITVLSGCLALLLSFYIPHSALENRWFSVFVGIDMHWACMLSRFLF